MGLLIPLFGDQEKNINLDSHTFQKMIEEDSNAVLLDVRTDQEFRNVRIPNSILIDIYESSFMDKIDRLERNKSYYIYCRSGQRSLTACRQMKQMGFERVFNLKPGIIGWHGNTEQD